MSYTKIHQVIIICESSLQLNAQAPAEKLFKSRWFKKALQLAKLKPSNGILIFTSTKGFVELDTLLEPYSNLLPFLNSQQKQELQDFILDTFNMRILEYHPIIVVCKNSPTYRNFFESLDIEATYVSSIDI